jgi:hypothetical protein
MPALASKPTLTTASSNYYSYEGEWGCKHGGETIYVQTIQEEKIA